MIAGLIVAAVFSFTLFLQYETYVVQKHGKHVNVSVDEVHGECGTGRSKAYFTFEFNGEIHRKDLITPYCSIEPLDTVMLLTNTDNTIFVYPDEKIGENMAVGGLLVLMCLFCAFKGYKGK